GIESRRFAPVFGTAAIPDKGFELAVLLVVTVQTEELPVAAIGRIVIVVVVDVMHGELAQVLAGKSACTAATHPGIQLERLLTVAFFALGDISALLFENAVCIVLAWRCAGHDSPTPGDCCIFHSNIELLPSGTVCPLPAASHVSTCSNA